MLKGAGKRLGLKVKQAIENADKAQNESEKVDKPSMRFGSVFKRLKANRGLETQEPESTPKKFSRNPLKRVMKNIAARAAGQPVAMKKGGMADKSGRAMKRKTADTKGRAMKKGK